MIDGARQQGFGQFSFEEFKERLLADLPAIERWVATIREFCTQEPTPATPSPCNGCPKREKCTEPCELVKPQLPKEYGGKIHGEGTINLSLDKVRNGAGFYDDLEEDDQGKTDRGKLKNFKNVVPINFFSEYEACWPIFSKKQQQVLALYHRDGKTITRIAKELHKWPSTVWGLLHRAEKRKQKDYGKQS